MKRRNRITYLPIASIVVAIVVVAAILTVILIRDVGRGRQQVEDLLHRQAGGILISLGASIRVGLGSPEWQPDRVPSFLADVVEEHSEVAYLAILDEDMRVVAHSEIERMGETWPDVPTPPSPRAIVGPRGDVRGLRDMMGRRRVPGDFVLRSRVVTADGRRVHEYVASVEIPPIDDLLERPRRMGWRHHMRMGREAAPDRDQLIERLSGFLGRPVDPTSPVALVGVVGLDPTDLEKAFHASRTYTLVLSAVLLIVGGAAIYFLFVTANYRAARTALANMRSYTTNVIESMASGLLSVDAGGRVVTANSGARSLLRLGTEIVEGKPLTEVLKLESERHRSDVGAVLSGEKSVAEAETRVLVEGESVPVALSASRLTDEDGAHSGAVLLFQDLREIEALKEAVERERHLASLGRLAAGVAHEVRNPLSSLKGFAQFLRSKFAPGSEEERYSDIMIEEVERLDRVVQELLDFARPVSPERRATEPRRIVGEALALVSEDAAFRNVAIETDLGERLPDVFVDPMQIRQALLNVLLNGIESMDEGGTLTVSARESVSHDGARTVTMDVADTGRGLSSEDLDKVFEPFYTTKPKGTGLGLTIVSRVLEQNGGRVEVESACGKGTTFSLVLPVAGGRSDALRREQEGP